MVFRKLPTTPYSGKAYYATALQAEVQDPMQGYWSNQPQKTESLSRSLKRTSLTGLGLAGFIGAGFLKTKTGNVWDKYIGALRTAEEYSPGGILRTLQLSNIFSPFASAVRNANVFISPEQLAGNKSYRNYLSSLIGKGTQDPFMRLGMEGVTLKGGKLFWGQGEEVALKYASAFTTQRHGSIPKIGAAYARLINAPEKGSFERLFSQVSPFSRATNPTIGGMPAQIIGGKSIGQTVYRGLGAVGTWGVERFNTLLNVPFENKFLQNNIGKFLNLSVEKTGGLRMLGKLAVKYGPALGGVALGYQSLDYLMKKSSLLDKTIFNEGLTVGISTALVKGNLAASKVAEVTGLHRYREKQEEIAPGSTDIQKLIAFPLIGSVSLGMSAYATKVYEMFKIRRNTPGPWAGEKMPVAMARELAESNLASFGGKGLLARAGRYLTSEAGVYSRQDLLGKFIRKIATPNTEGKLAYKLLGNIGPVKLATTLGASIGALAILPFLPGALIPGKRPGELRDIYSGKQEVAVRRGRWWSLGRSPYEGGRISYFRPHWYARMRMDARDKSIWGDKEPNPLTKWFKKEFTYDLEKKFYEDRPYPITSLPFEDVPLVGTLLANTIGRIIKPPKLMHTEEWMGPGGTTRSDYSRYGERTATDIGQVPDGKPISPYSPTQTIGKQIYNMTEMVGLPGWLSTVAKEKLSGTPDWFDKEKQLESARRIHSSERWYWDQELGDMFMTNEALRRLYPHRQRQIDLYNPIRNTMPTWMPGPGDKSPDFLHGDPYTKVPEGELRLPGKGYEARYPELAGTKPEDYPLIQKYKILADIAPYSDAFGKVVSEVRTARKSKKTWSDEDQRIWETTNEQIKQKKQVKTFQEYKYLGPLGELFPNKEASKSTAFVAAINQQKATAKPGAFQKLAGGYWEMISHNAETSLDMLTPIAPGAKLVHQRTAIESYEREQAYGTGAAFWKRPIENFIAPFFRTLGKELGYKDIPDKIQKKRVINEQFDILKYVKNTRLSNIATHHLDPKAAAEFRRKADETLFGVNPFTRRYENIYRALPKAERDYFESFETAKSTEERQRILELVPENEKSLYIARWKLAHATEVRTAKKEGILTNQELEKADSEIKDFYKEAESEGLPSSKELFGQYSATRTAGESYADWYRRVFLLADKKLPGPDWVGWHPSVDLDDVKLKVVQTLGEDMHDYDLWESREKELPYKPYLDNEAISAITHPDNLSKEQMRDRVNQVLDVDGLQADTFVSSFYRPKKHNEIHVTIDQDRKEDMKHAMSKMH